MSAVDTALADLSAAVAALTVALKAAEATSAPAPTPPPAPVPAPPPLPANALINAGVVWALTADNHLTINGQQDPVAVNVGQIVDASGTIYITLLDGTWQLYGGAPGKWTTVPAPNLA